VRCARGGGDGRAAGGRAGGGAADAGRGAAGAGRDRERGFAPRTPAAGGAGAAVGWTAVGAPVIASRRTGFMTMCIWRPREAAPAR